MHRPDLSIFIVNYNTAHLLVEVFDALEQATLGIEAQIILVDNASTDNSVAIMESQYPQVQLIKNPVNLGFGRANNQCIALSNAPYVLLLNTDAFVAADSIRKTLDYMQNHNRCGLLGVKLVSRDGSLQPSCRYFPTPWNIFLGRTGLWRLFPKVPLVDDMEWDHNNHRSCDWVPGCYYLIRSSVIDEVGLFDPRYFLYYEEVDHCMAVKKACWRTPPLIRASSCSQDDSGCTPRILSICCGR